MYATAAGLLLFSQSEMQDAVDEPEDKVKRSFLERIANGWNTMNNKLKGIF